MKDILTLFDNRELALLIWIAVVLAVAMAKRDVRSALFGVVTALAAPKVRVVLVLFFAYVVAVIWGLRSAGLWTTGQASDTLFWLLGPGVALLMGVSTRKKGEAFFRSTLARVFAATIVLEFLLNRYPGSYVFEIVLAPVVFILIAGLVYSEHRSEYRQVRSALISMTAFVVVGLVVHTALNLASDPGEVLSMDGLRGVLLPVLLTIACVPILWVVGIYSAYDKAFVWIRFGNDNRRSRIRSRLALITKLHFRTRDLLVFTMSWGGQVTEASSFKEARRVVDEFRGWAEEERLAPIRKRERLERFAGVEGEDEDGRRLDQREFEQTKRALQHLVSAQMGWYRRRGGRYREELLKLMAPQFQRAGLHRDHGIALHVSSDGQSWWAWRRTVTGWCFGAGAAGPPPDEWLYDAPTPPSGPPGKSDGWSQWGSEARNWD